MKRKFTLLLLTLLCALTTFSAVVLLGCGNKELTAEIETQILEVGESVTISPKYNEPKKSEGSKWNFMADKEGIVEFDGLVMTAKSLGSTRVEGKTDSGIKTVFEVYVIIPAENVGGAILAVNETTTYSNDYAISSLTPEILQVNGRTVKALATGKGVLQVYDVKNNSQNLIGFTVNNEYPYSMKLKSYNGEEIKNFNDNKFAFTVSVEDDATVKIDGKEVGQGYGVHQYGAHNVTVSKDGKDRNFEVNLLEPASGGETYDVIATYATLPTLYAGLNAVSSDNEKFIWFGRRGTLSEAVLQADEKVTLSKYIGDTSKLAVNVVSEIKDYCYKKLNESPDAKFRLYVDDFRHWIEITAFAEMGLNDDRYEVYYCSDGTKTYTENYSFRNGPIEKYNEVCVERAAMVANARSNTYANDVTDNYMNEGDSKAMDFHDDFIIAGAARNNIFYWAQYPEFCKSADALVQDIMFNSIDKKLPELMYKALSATEKQAFLQLIALDKVSFDETYFNEGNGKEYLVITGTNPYGAGTKDLIQKVVQKYGAEYNLLFKPHPNAIPQGEDAQELANLGVKVLPGRLPMEALLWVYPECKTGGYNSSLYMSAPKGNTLFFFANSVNDLISPIKELYDSLFYNAEFIV